MNTVPLYDSGPPGFIYRCLARSVFCVYEKMIKCSIGRDVIEEMADQGGE